MEKSESTIELTKALIKVQSEISVVRHDADNPFYKSKYASLGAVISATKPILEKNGLAISQFPSSNENGVGVNTILMHESGEFISDIASVKIPSASKKPGEDAGKIITYLRRYAWQSVLGVYSGDDDDMQSFNKPQPAQWTQEQIQAVVKSGVAKNDFNAKAILERSNVKSPNNSPEWCVWYAKAYRKATESGLTKDDSFEKANNAYSKAQEK